MTAADDNSSTANPSPELETSTFRKVVARGKAVSRLIRYFIHPARFVLLPFLGVLLLAGILLWLTGGLAYVAPFVYSLF